MRKLYQLLTVTLLPQKSFMTMMLYLIVCLPLGNNLVQAQHQSKPVQFDFEAIKSSLRQAPDENLGGTAPAGTIISLDVDGEMLALEVWHSNILSDEFQALYPDIQTFRFSAVDNPLLTGRITLTNQWLNLSLITSEGILLITPDNLLQPTQYALRSENEQLAQSAEDHKCRFEEEKTAEDEDQQRMIHDLMEDNSRTLIPNGATLRTYNLAIVCTGEYSVANGGPSIPTVTASVVTGVNNIQAIYDRDLAVRFNLLTPFVYTDPATDPFIPDMAGGCGRTSQASHIVALNFPNGASYDLGHVFHAAPAPNWSGGGVAGLGVVCNNNTVGPCTQGPAPGTTYTTGLSKGGGWSVGWDTGGGPLISLTAHEIGHQFGANHTFNGTGSNCTAAISSTTAYEIGSGTSIMSYLGICQADNNIPYSGNPYFHTQSLEEMLTYINSGGGNCAATAPTGNTPPTVSANPCGNPSYTIPHSTPFILTGSGTGSLGESLTYVWEQTDEDGAGTPTQGFIGATAGASPIAPLFRSYFPSSSPTRHFPAIALVNNNTALTNSFEPLPTVARTLNFKLTVRDNNASGGGTNGAALAVTVSGTGPLAVTAPNGGETWTTGTNVTVNWSNNTAALSANVNIELSVDGGLTYPYTLAANTSNDGSWTGELPTVIPNHTTVRLRVISSDNTCVRFYDVSDNNFTITSNCAPNTSFVCPVAPVALPQGDAGLDLSPTVDNTTPLPVMAVNIIAGTNPTGQLVNRQAAGTIVCAPYWGVVPYQVFTFKVTQAGTYSFSDGASTVMYSLFSSGGYIPATPCNNWLQSNNYSTGGGGIGWVDGFDFVLNPCNVYHIVAWDAFDPPNLTGSITLNGPGSAYTFGALPANYSQTFAAVNTANSQVAAVSNEANFMALPVGDYAMYNMTYFSGAGTNPPASVPATWVGNTLTQVKSTNCVLESQNSISVTVQVPLPVALHSFTAELTNDRQTKLEWITESELNNDYFEVERSLDGINFESLERVRGKGTTELKQYYEAWDTKPVKGSNYYRLKQVDYDGLFEYSNVKVVLLDSDELSFVLFPNPVSHEFTIQLDGNQEGGMLRLFNTIGQQVLLQTMAPGELEQSIPVAHLPRGVYYLDLVVNGKHANQKLLVH
jgi:Metallo-peptidase family M12/Secretion system C-terminal sorting domain